MEDRAGVFRMIFMNGLRSSKADVYADHCCFSAANQLRDLRTQLTHLDRSSSLTIDKEHFQANIDVQQFRPDEISVRLLDDHSVKVEAKHEEQQDDHGFISRHFVRRYLLPKDCDPTKLKSKLSADGILVITAPKKQEDDAIEGQEIPISH
ncbi:hypothetical protein D910_05924, partial [Dendroctonus ponderosae]